MALSTGNGEPAILRTLRGDPCAEHIAVEPLEVLDTAAQTVWFLDRHQIQIAAWLPWHRRAAVAEHHRATHTQECCVRSCAQARTWAREAQALAGTAIPPICASLPA